MTNTYGSGDTGLQQYHSDIKESTVGGRRSVVTYVFPNNQFTDGQVQNFVLPKLDKNTTIDPKTIELEFLFENKNDKSFFRNNLGRLLVERLEVMIGGTTVYLNKGESVFEVYRDLWRSAAERARFGLAGENARK